MNYKAKSGSIVNYIDVFVHQKCLILNVSGKNTLYEFNEASRLIDDVKVYLDAKSIEHLKCYLSNNSSKVKFSKKEEDQKQLSLF